jgi:hypothetical protein
MGCPHTDDQLSLCYRCVNLQRQQGDLYVVGTDIQIGDAGKDLVAEF